MKTFGMVAVLTALALVAACNNGSDDTETSQGGGPSVSTGGTHGGGAGASGAGGSTAAGGGGNGGASCNFPLCLFNMYAACPGPSTGPCTTQADTANLTATCYSNGTKTISARDPATPNVTTLTYKNGNTVCYSQRVELTGTDPTYTTASSTYRDGSGNVVATGVFDSTTQLTTITCTGSQPVTLNSACDQSSSEIFDCTPGICAP